MSAGETEELAEWILGELQHSESLTTDCIVQAWMIDVGKGWVRETLVKLRDKGMIKSDQDGAQWKLRTDPVTVAEVRGDPNFRRGGV